MEKKITKADGTEPLAKSSHSFSIEITKFVKATASGYGIFAVVAVALVALVYLLRT